jgi:hypothetical protein
LHYTKLLATLGGKTAPANADLGSIEKSGGEKKKNKSLHKNEDL